MKKLVKRLTGNTALLCDEKCIQTTENFTAKKEERKKRKEKDKKWKMIQHRKWKGWNAYRVTYCAAKTCKSFNLLFKNVIIVGIEHWHSSWRYKSKTLTELLVVLVRLLLSDRYSSRLTKPENNKSSPLSFALPVKPTYTGKQPDQWDREEHM